MSKIKLGVALLIVYVVFCEVALWGLTNNWQLNSWFVINALLIASLGWVPGFMLIAYHELLEG